MKGLATTSYLLFRRDKLMKLRSRIIADDLTEEELSAIRWEKGQMPIHLDRALAYKWRYSTPDMREKYERKAKEHNASLRHTIEQSHEAAEVPPKSDKTIAVPSAERGESSEECIVCLDRKRSHVAVPCGHLCLCAQCASELEKRSMKCPYCMKQVTLFARVYTP